jgi:hypothetical protein
MTLFAIWADKRDSVDTSTTDRIHEALAADSIIKPCSPSRGTVGPLHWHVQDYPTRFYDRGARLYVGDGFTTLSGYTWIRGGDILDAHGIHATVGERDVLDLRSVLGGEFTIAHVGSNGALTAFADRAGIQSLFYCDTHEVFAVSNRVGMLRHLIHDAGLDLESTLGILAIGYRVGTGTVCRHVRTVPQNGYVRFVDGRCEIVDGRRGLFPEQRNLGWDAIDNPQAVLQDGIDYATQAVRIAYPGDGPVSLPISGGLDSRVVLALCLAAGLKDRLTLYTNGAPDHPDVVSGQMIAASIGVSHRDSTPVEKPARYVRRPWRRSASRAKRVGAKQFVEDIQTFAFLNDAMFSAWDLQIPKQATKDLLMTGHMGEVLKHNGKKAAAGNSILDRVRQATTIDSLDYLTPDALTVLENTIEAEIAPLAETFSTDDIPDIYYYTQRIPNWLGAFSPTSTFVATRVHPLNSPSLLKLAWQLTQPERKSRLIHFHIIKALAPGLLSIPFCAQTWDTSLAQYHPGLNTTESLAVPKVTTTKLFGSWQHQLNQNDALLIRLRDMCSAHPNSPLWSVVDRSRMDLLLQRGRYSMPDMIRLLGFLPLFMREHGYLSRKPIVIA